MEEESLLFSGRVVTETTVQSKMWEPRQDHQMSEGTGKMRTRMRTMVMMIMTIITTATTTIKK